MELLGPVPVGPVTVAAEVVRAGRTVELCRARLYDDDRDRLVAEATAWRFPAGTDGPGTAGEPPLHRPHHGQRQPRPPSWSGGYLDAVEWRWVEGAVLQPGPALVWMRPPALVAGEPITPLQRLMACVDSASGISAVLDPASWTFVNTELTVHVLRPLEGDWVCVRARTTLSTGSVGLADAEVYDESGLVARSAQALLVAPVNGLDR